jgi:hypothetical protein
MRSRGLGLVRAVITAIGKRRRPQHWRAACDTIVLLCHMPLISINRWWDDYYS